MMIALCLGACAMIVQSFDFDSDASSAVISFLSISFKPLFSLIMLGFCVISPVITFFVQQGI
jgi:hypothetical protein